ncbi:MAG: hypothetical protein HFF06_02765 [Oscillospiraceae bacterium]|jgi:hypothetical protein|nr:hypothetical protein [Oscillospiraceae bacterium]
MTLILRDGDYVPDGKGGFQRAAGAEELLERILWKLSVRRGSFPFLPELGSRLHLLGWAPARERQALAGQYVTEALADEEVTLTGTELEGERLTLRLEWRGESLTAAMKVGGMT